MTEVLVERPQWVLDAMRKANEAYELSKLRRELSIDVPQQRKKSISKFGDKRKAKRIFGLIPITIDNFFLSSIGTFKEINEIPEGFILFFTSKTSTYFTNEDNTILIRKSDHWGSKIRSCNWYLSGYPRELSKRWKKFAGTSQRFGMIAFSELKSMN